MRPKNEKMKMQIFGYIKDYILKEGSSPTLDEVAAVFNCSKQVAFKYINRLIDDGYLMKVGRYKLALCNTNLAMKEIPVYSRIPCGSPLVVNNDIEEYIRLPEEIVGHGDFYIVIASGKSMKNAGIDDGDMVIIKAQDTADDGDVAVVLTDETENTLKRIYFEQDKVRLHPENDAMEDFYVNKCRIQGVAVKVIKNIK